jgi:site-specific DNA recombinase
MANLIGYVRVSTEDQAAHGVSISAQVREIVLWVERNHHTLAGIETDDGVSGGQRIEHRQGGRRVLEALATGRAQGIVAVAQDRIYRDDAGWALLVTACDETRTPIYITSRGPQPTTATAQDRMYASFASTMATGYRMAVKEHTARALRDLRARGQVYSKNPPITAKKVGRKLVDDPKMIEAAQLAAAMYDKGTSLRKIADDLVLTGFPNPRTKTGRWHHDSIRSLIAQKDGWRSTQPGFTGPEERSPRARAPKKANAFLNMLAASAHRKPVGGKGGSAAGGKPAGEKQRKAAPK